MGDSLPPPATFDLVGSYARRRGTDVEIVLAKPEAKVGDGATVVLRKGKATVHASAQLSDDPRYDTTLTIRAPREQFVNGRWSMTLQSASTDRERLAARLLVQGDRPLVLLWGAKNTPSASARKRRPDSVKGQAVATAGKALDRALGVLPEDRGVQVRAKLRTAARRILR